MKTKMVLCKLRHKHPVIDELESIFPVEIDPFDFMSMAQTVSEKLAYVEELELYVTGLTPALASVLNYCTLHAIPCALWHFNKLTDTYVRQVCITDVLSLSEAK